MASLSDEISSRRTFAIISHPDAGKTTLTEKLLLYTGSIQTAGSVKGKSSAKHAVSDWMDIEKERGISVTSSVLQFTYNGACVNILDTPGHQDFSEDTYRTLMAADAAVMVIDGAKGVEAAPSAEKCAVMRLYRLRSTMAAWGLGVFCPVVPGFCLACVLSSTLQRLRPSNGRNSAVRRVFRLLSRSGRSSGSHSSLSFVSSAVSIWARQPTVRTYESLSRFGA